MSEQSKMPSIDEVTKMAGKLFADLKKSISEIYQDYQTKHTKTEAPPAPKSTSTESKAKKKPKGHDKTEEDQK